MANDLAESMTMEDAGASLIEQQLPAAQESAEELHQDSPSIPALREDDLTMEQALDFVSDDDRPLVPAVGSHQPIAKIDDRAVTLPELVNGYVAGRELKDLVYGVDARYDQILAAAQDIAYSATVLAEYLTSQLPPKPPAALSFSNPAEFTRQQVIHETAFNRVMAVLESAEMARKNAVAINAQRHANALQRENQRLIAHFPECAEPEGRERFFDTMREVAYACDFSEEELRQVVDHRMFRLAHLASLAIGKNKEKPKPQKRKSQPSGDAFNRLETTGSIDDAMAVEFD